MKSGHPSETNQWSPQGSDDKYLTLFNQARDGIGLIDLETGLIVDCNQEFENLAGRRLRELQKMKIWELRPPGKVQAAERKFLEIKDRGTGGSMELEFQKPNGEIVSIEFVSKVVKIQGKEYIQSNVRDIAERKRAEVDLQNLTRILEERVKELNCLFGVAELIERPGISVDQILQGTVDLLPPAWRYPGITCARITLEDQVFITDNFRETIWKLSSDITISGSLGGIVEVYYLEERPESDEGPFLKEERKLLKAIAARLGRVIERLRASEALKQSEKKYREFADSLPQIVFEIDKTGNFTFINLRALENYGYTREDLDRGLNVLQVVAPEDVKRVKKDITRAFRGDRSAREEYTALRKDGTRFPIAVHSSPVIRQNKVTGFRGVVVDMTQLKKAEQALQESEKKHRTLVEQSLQGMVVIQDFRICFANTAIAQICGYTIEELFSLSPEELRALVHPQDQALVWGRLPDRLAGKRVPAEYECRITRKDGALRWVEMFSSLIQYRGKPAVQAALIDITERKQTEERLEWELEVNGALAKLSGALITPFSSIEDMANMVLDSARSLTQSKHGYVSSIDPKTGDTVAHTLTKMLGKQCLVRREDRRIRFPKGANGRYPGLWGHALNSQEAFFTNSPGRHEASRGIPEGHIPVKNFLSVPAVIGKHLVGQIALANSTRDYTNRDLEAIKRLAGLYAVAIERKRVEEALRESEEKFRNLAEQSPNMIFINKKGRVVYANKKCEEVTGYKREEFYSPDFDFFRLVPSECVDLVKTAFGKHAKGEEIAPYEYALVSKGGKKIEAIHTTKLIKYEGDSAILGIITDITERKRAEEEIQKLNKSLESQAEGLRLANKELQAFSYSVSHDLRAPLRAIDGFSKALLEDYHDKLEEQGRDYLTRVRTSTRHMTQLIDDLLNLSLVMRAEIRRKKTNLSKLARTISKELQKAEPQREVEFVIPEGVYAHGDPRLLRRVLENLLGNAWKFTANHPRATVEFGATKKGSDTVYFVRDDGAGFDITYANRLFIPFQRLHSTAEFSGSGIGLAIANRIINRHGGRIWAEGQVEKGATFYFTLPQEKEVKVIWTRK